MRYISIRDKLILNYVIIGVTVITIIGTFSYYTAQNALYERTFDQLTSLRIARKNQVETFFRERIQDIMLLSNSEDVSNILNHLNTDPANHTYGSKIGKSRNEILRYFEQLDYYDGVFFSGKEGQTMIYTENPGYNDAVPDIDQFQKYMQTSEGPTAKQYFISDITDRNIFIGAEVYAPENRSLGYVILRMPLNTINNIMFDSNPKNGLGKSGESYLVGKDLLMRSPSRFNDSSVLHTSVNTASVLKALRGQEGTSVIKDYRGINVLSSYSNLNIPGLNWVILAEIDSDEALEKMSEIRNSILMISTLIALLLFTYAFYASALFTSPVIKLKEATQRIARGDFDQEIEVSSNDEIGDLVTSFNYMLLRLKNMTEELKKERFKRLRSVIDGQELERQRLSRELHDGLGQLMIALKLQLENTQDTDLKTMKTSIKEVSESFDNTIDEIKRISNNLMPAVLNEFGIINALRNLTEEIEEYSGIETDFISRDVDLHLNKKQKTYVYRIVQEALNNAVKHASASKIILSLVQSSEYLTIRIEDNGKGFDYNKVISESGNGLHNMNERSALLNGNFNLQSTPGKGTLIVINIPV